MATDLESPSLPRKNVNPTYKPGRIQKPRTTTAGRILARDSCLKKRLLREARNLTRSLKLQYLARRGEAFDIPLCKLMPTATTTLIHPHLGTFLVSISR